MKKKDASVIKRKILFQMGLLTLCVMGIGLLAYMICTSEYFAAFLKNMTGFDLSSFQSGFRSFLHTGSVEMMLFILVLTGLLVFLIYWGFSKRLMRYLNVISASIDVLLSPDQLSGETSRLNLPHEMSFFEVKLGTLEQTLVDRDRAAQVAERRKNRLVITLAQEIKTPLALLSEHLKRINDEPYMTVERRVQSTGFAMEKAQEMHELLNDFFEITRYSLENTKLSPQLIDLNQMFAQIIDLLRPLLVKQGKEIVLNAEEGSVLFAEPQKIASAFYSIMKKAIVHSEDRSVIYIEALCKGNQTFVSVASYGKTIRKEMLESLLENFYNEQDKMPPAGKSGLGLAVAREIVLLHHGSLEAQSEEGKTVFTVILPLPLRARQQNEARSVFEHVAHLVPRISDDVQIKPATDRDRPVPKELEYSIRENEQATISGSAPFGAANPQMVHWQDKTVSLDYESTYPFDGMQTDPPRTVSGESELRPRDSKSSIFDEPEYPQTSSPGSLYEESVSEQRRHLQEDESGAPYKPLYSSIENLDIMYFDSEHLGINQPQREQLQAERPQRGIPDPVFGQPAYPLGERSGTTSNQQGDSPGESIDFTYFEPEFLQTGYPQMQPLQTGTSEPVFTEPGYPQGDRPGVVPDRLGYPSAENPNFTYFKPEGTQTENPQTVPPQTEHRQKEPLQTEISDPVFEEPRYRQTESPQTETLDPLINGPKYPQDDRCVEPNKPGRPPEDIPDFTYFEPEYPQIEHLQTGSPESTFEEPIYPQEETPIKASEKQGYPSAENLDFTYFEPEPEYPQPEYPQPEYPQPEYPQMGISHPVFDEPRYPQEDNLGNLPKKLGYPSEENPDFTYFEPEYQQPEYQQREIPDPASEESKYPQEEALAATSAESGHIQKDIPSPSNAFFDAELARGNIFDSAYDEAGVSQAYDIGKRSGEREFCQVDGLGAEDHESEYAKGGFAFGEGDPLDAPVTQPDRPRRDDRPSRDYRIQSYHHKYNNTSRETGGDFPIQRGHEFMHKSSANDRRDEDKNK